MREFTRDVWKIVTENDLLNIAAAAVILIAGLLLALWIRQKLRAVLQKSKLSKKLAFCLPEHDAEKTELPSSFLASFSAGIVLLLTLLACFSALGLAEAAQPIRVFLDRIWDYLPNLTAGLLLIFLTWFIAAALKYGVQLLLLKLRLDERIEEKYSTDGTPCELSSSIAAGASILVWLLFLPAILRSLRIDGVTASLEAMFGKIFTYLPNLFAAAVIAAAGLFAASLLRKLVAGLLTNLPKCKDFARPLSLIVYALTALPVIVAALDALQLEVLSGSTGELFSRLLNAAGNIFGAALAVAVSWFAGKFAADLIKKLLPEIGFRKLAAAAGIKSENPENGVAGLVFLACVLAGSLAGLELMGFRNLADLLRSFIPFAGNLLMAAVVLFAGLLAADFAVKHTQAEGWRRTLLKAVIWFFAGAVALHYTGIGAPIVQTAFTLILGAAAVAAAIAFGIGGRDIAAQKLKEWTKDKDRNGE